MDEIAEEEKIGEIVAEQDEQAQCHLEQTMNDHTLVSADNAQVQQTIEVEPEQEVEDECLSDSDLD